MTTLVKNFTLRDFSDLDHSPNIDYLIASMEAHYQQASMREIKQAALDMMQLKPGDHVIELGCGLGHDAEMLADRVGKTGSVIAIDNSHHMIFEAQKRSTHANVSYRHGDINQLNFADHTFSACRADRLLVSQENVDRVLSEACRVTKPNGQICITALDFGGIILSPYFEQLTDLIVKHWQQLVRNPFIGRKLPALFRQHGLIDIKIKPHVFTVQRYSALKNIVEFEVMLADMVSQHTIAENQKNQMIEKFNEADQKGDFFWSINLFTVLGIKHHEIT